MQTFKKTWWAMGLAVLAFVIFFRPGHVLAVTYDSSFWDSANYTLKDNNTIYASNGGHTVIFDNPSGSTYPKGTYRVQGSEFGAPGGFCDITSSITLDPSNLSKASIPAAINVEYVVPVQNGASTSSCNNYQKSSLTITNPTGSGTSGGSTCNYLVCNKNDISNLASSNFKFAAIDTITTTFKGKKITFIDGVSNDSDHTYQAPSGLFCSGGGRDHFGAITISSDNYPDAQKGKANVPGSLDVDWYDAANKNCNNFGTDSNNNTSSIKIDATAIAPANLVGAACTPGSTTIPAGFDCVCASSQGCALEATTTSGSSTDNSSGPACAIDETSLEWIICPVIAGVSKAADGMNAFISSQLNFSIHDNLPSGGSVQKAWAIFRDLTSVILVIVMLVMVISQAMGEGPFDAYTVKKLLPRLVVAVIVMQISWQICTWLIGLANDAGQGIAGLLAVPFGGITSLDLPHLLTRLNDAVALGLGVVTEAGAIGAVFAASAIIAYGWPVILLAVLLIFMAVLVALATLLFRNALIILLVILAPLAFLAAVLPGTENYWKMWRQNFSKLLLFFPLVMAMIYGGRIFSWVAGGLGSAGLFDLLAVLAGFFGPYFFLPKTFKWGGSALAAANTAINSSWPVKKGREVANRELMAAQNRNMQDYGKDKLNPGASDYYRYTARKAFGIPYGFKKTNPEGKLGKTLLTNALSGRVLPTRRALGAAIAKQDKNDAEERALDKVIAERGRNKKTSAEGDIAAGKKMSMNQLQHGLERAARGKNMFDKLRGEREATAALEDLVDSRSFFELARMQIIDPADGQEKHVWETDFWRNKVASNREMYAAVSRERPDWQPHRLPSGLPKYRGEIKEGWEESMRNDLTQQGLQSDEVEARVATRRVEVGLLQEGDKDARYAEALKEVMSETDPRKFDSISPIMFERIGQMAQKGAELETPIEQAQRAGNTALATKLRVKQNMLMEPAQQFSRMVDNLIKTGNQYQLSALQGGDESIGMVNLALKYTGPNGVHGGGAGLVERQTAGQPQAAQAQSGSQTQSGSANSEQGRTIRTVKSGEGETVYVHNQPPVLVRQGESVTPGGVILPTGVQNAQMDSGELEELNHNLRQLRSEFHSLRGLASRNQQQQQRFDQLRGDHPDWENEDNPPA